ncbi:MAG: MFS transporter [Betaproteobacteria bacterium]|nr:MAG: MFS transporter [Betaproteobacteria bacterium]
MWLSVAQLISWGTLFYTFSLLLEHFERDLNLSRVDASIAFSLALLTEGVLAFYIGRMIDAGRARAVMCAGSLLAAVGFVAMAFVQAQWQLYATWLLLGVAMAGTLYQPAFSILIRRYPTDFRRAIITLTFLGGLASTVFIPLMAWLISAFTWRGAVIALAVLHVAICLPIHAYWLRGEPVASAHEQAAKQSLSSFTTRFPFWGLAVFFVLFSGITTSIGAHLVSILRERDLPATWVIVIPASIGVLQVAGRLVLFFTEKHIDVHKANRWIPVLLPAALFVLALGLKSPWVAIFYALLYGMANGMITIVKATAMAQYVSRERAASLNGLLGFPTAVARAAAPSLLAALWTISGNYVLGLSVMAASGALAVVAFWVAQRRALRLHQ